MQKNDATSLFRAFQGTLGLSVAMGIGRFFFTPVLPIMIAALNWSGSASAWVATANYLGYLLGSALMARGWLNPSIVIYRCGLVASTVLLVLIALTPSVGLQLVIRLAAGFVSALIFVCITHVVNSAVQPARRVGIVYGGVGFGIIISGLGVFFLGNVLGWKELWVFAAIVSAIFSLIAWNWPAQGDEQQADAQEPGMQAAQGANKARAFLLDLGYFFEGFGYIIIGTYLVVLAKPLFGASAAALTWVIAGLAACPSPIFWSWAAERYGRRLTLSLCYVLQVIGAFLAIFSGSGVLLIIAAFLFGATFMGITMLTISTGVAAGFPGASARLTTGYSIGQVLGPAIVGLFLGDSITAAFILAAVTIALAATFTMASRL